MDFSPVLISLKTSAISIFITFFLGLWAARWVVSMRSERAKAWIDGILTMPLVLPPTVAGFSCFISSGRNVRLDFFWKKYSSTRLFLHGRQRC